MIKTFEVQLLPTTTQLEQLAQHAGATRWLWNQMVARNIEKYNAEQKFNFKYDMISMIPELKKEFPWLKDVNSQSLQHACIQLHNALMRVGKKSKKSAGFPKFKSKHRSCDSFVVPQHFHINKQHIKLPKIGKLKYLQQRPFEGKVKQIIVKLKQDKWFAYISCEIDDVLQINDVHESEIIGIDLGISDFAILSNGSKISNPKNTKLFAKKLAKHQRRLSRKKKKGSNNRIKQIKRVRKVHRKIANRRNDFQWKHAHSIAKMAPVVSVETLNVKGMIKNRKLSKHIADASWYSFKAKLKHQLSKRGGFIVEIDRFAPSSKTCSSCGTIYEELQLSEREWTCSSCGVHHDRDVNAAINIRQFGINELYRLGTCRIYTCGDISSDLLTCSANETMSLNQEKESSLDDPTCSLDKW